MLTIVFVIAVFVSALLFVFWKGEFVNPSQSQEVLESKLEEGIEVAISPKFNSVHGNLNYFQGSSQLFSDDELFDIHQSHVPGNMNYEV